MPFDDVAWEQSELISDAWVKDLFKEDNLRAIGNCIVTHRAGNAIELCDPRGGAFNVSFRMNFQVGNPALIRLTKPGTTMFPDEKSRYEVAVIALLRDRTSIPLPFVLHWGTKKESPLGDGAFMIMDYIEHTGTMNDPLNTPSFKREDRPVLDPDIDPAKLDMLYGQMADIILQLSSVRLPRIGSVTQVDDFTWEATSRPLTIVMNQLVALGTLPRAKLPSTPFESASSYFNSLADLHMDHLIHQRNDAVDSADDCRRKFVARTLFRKLAKEGRLASSTTDNGPFPIWCDDFRPASVLVNEDMETVGVVDWEFSYAAPVEFSHAPPWWLLLEQPEYWPEGLDAWEDLFDMRLKAFINVLIERENSAIRRGRLREDQRLSGGMVRSWETGDFWVVYAARKSFAFDAIFWKKIEPRFFGASEVSEEERWRDRLCLLDSEEKEGMEMLVKRKLEEMKERVLAWDVEETSI